MVFLDNIHRAFDVVSPFVDHMGVDHGGFEVFVAEEFLYGADVVAVLEEMGGKGMAQGVAGYFFVEPCFFSRFFDPFLNISVGEMVAVMQTTSWIFGDLFGWEQILPPQFFVFIRMFL